MAVLEIIGVIALLFIGSGALIGSIHGMVLFIEFILFILGLALDLIALGVELLYKTFRRMV